MPDSRFCTFHDHQECADRDMGKFCECDCHKPEGWVDAKLSKWKIDKLPISGGLIVLAYFRDSLEDIEWEWKVGVWSAAKMIGIPAPEGANPLSRVKTTPIIQGIAKNKNRPYEIKLDGFRTTMRRKDPIELRMRFVRLKAQLALERGE